MTSQRRMLVDAALVLAARTELADLAAALAVDLGNDRAAAALQRWLDDTRPLAAEAMRRLSRA